MLRVLLVFSTLAAGVPAAAESSRALEFSEVSLPVVGERISGVHPADLDGDGRVDLLVQTRARFLGFRGEGGGKIATSPALAVALPEGTVIYDLADLDGDPAVEVAVMTQGGVTAYDVDLGAGRLVPWATPIVQQATVFRAAVAPEPRRHPFLVDLRRQGIHDCLLPQSRAIFTYENDGKGHFRARPALSFAPETDLEVERPWNRSSGQDPSARLKTTVRIPRLEAAEVGGIAGQRDLLAIDGRKIAIYRRNAEGILDTLTSSSFTVPEPERDDRKRMRLINLPTLLGDVDGDGMTDLVVADSAGGRAALHLQRGGTWAGKADDLVTVPGWLVGADLDDLDGDGRDDLALVRIDQVDLWDALAIITSRLLPVEISVYLARDGGFEERPAFREAADIPLRFGGEGPSTMTVEAGFIPSAEGDHDGDGVKDIVLLAGRDTLRLVGAGARDASGQWRELASLRVAGLSAYRSTTPVAVDLDGDGKDDLVLIGRGWDDAAGDELRVLVARGRR